MELTKRAHCEPILLMGKSEIRSLKVKSKLEYRRRLHNFYVYTGQIYRKKP